ncbi:MAG: hypothetical protein ACE5NC_07385 [Anaerolineae bacterium]
MSIPHSWRGQAFNQSPDSQNQIHSDELAKEYGFRGGLVPGVTISAYLVHPAVVAWGEDWLSRGHAHIVVGKPLYDDLHFQVQVSETTDHSCHAVLVDEEGTHCANAFVNLPEQPPDKPVRRYDAFAQPAVQPPNATRSVMEELQSTGMNAFRYQWNHDHPMSTYLKNQEQMPDLLNGKRARYANSSFMLGLTNWVLSGNVYMNPWIHLQTDSQHYAPVPLQSALIVECAITDLFEKKGHEFVDVQVDAYLEQTDEPVMSASLRAIYQLRAPK